MQLFGQIFCSKQRQTSTDHHYKKFSSFFQVLHLHQQAKDSRDQAAGLAKQNVEEKPQEKSVHG